MRSYHNPSKDASKPRHPSNRFLRANPYDLVGPFHGPCGLCGGPDARHRMYDAIQGRINVGDDVGATAEDYGFTVEQVQAIADGPEGDDVEQAMARHPAGRGLDRDLRNDPRRS